MRSKTLFSIFVASLMAYTTSAQKVNVQPVHVEAPFPMDSVHLCTFPNKEFSITKYGAQKGSNQTPRHLPKPLKHATVREADEW